MPVTSRLHPSFDSETSATRLYSVGSYSSVLVLACRVGSRGLFAKLRYKLRKPGKSGVTSSSSGLRLRSHCWTPWHDWEHYQRTPNRTHVSTHAFASGTAIPLHPNPIGFYRFFMQYHWLGDMGSCEERAVSGILARRPACLEARSRTHKCGETALQVLPPKATSRSKVQPLVTLPILAVSG